MTDKATMDAGKALLSEMKSNPDLAAKVNGATSFEEFQSVAKAAGYDVSGLTEEEARALASGGTAAPVGELSDEDLEQVAGGWGDVSVNMNNW